MTTTQHRKCPRCGKNRSYDDLYKKDWAFLGGELICSHCYVTKLCGYEKCWTRRPHHERPDETRPHQRVAVLPDHVGKAFCSLECSMYAGYGGVRGWKKDPRTEEVFDPPVTSLPDLSKAESKDPK